MRLNLGCGSHILPASEGWVNIDIHPGEGVDRVMSIVALDYPAESVDEIFARHVIEHIHPADWPGTLAEWVRMLKPGGIMVIEAPDLQKVCEGFAHDTGGIRWKWWHKVIYGPDRREGQPHLQGFTIPRLVGELHAVGMLITRARAWGDNSDPNDPTRTAAGLPSYNLRVEAVKA